VGRGTLLEGHAKVKSRRRARLLAPCERLAIGNGQVARSLSLRIRPQDRRASSLASALSQRSAQGSLPAPKSALWPGGRPLDAKKAPLPAHRGRFPRSRGTCSPPSLWPTPKGPFVAFSAGAFSWLGYGGFTKNRSSFFKKCLSIKPLWIPANFLIRPLKYTRNAPIKPSRTGHLTPPWPYVRRFQPRRKSYFVLTSFPGLRTFLAKKP